MRPLRPAGPVARLRVRETDRTFDVTSSSRDLYTNLILPVCLLPVCRMDRGTGSCPGPAPPVCLCHPQTRTTLLPLPPHLPRATVSPGRRSPARPRPLLDGGALRPALRKSPASVDRAVAKVIGHSSIGDVAAAEAAWHGSGVKSESPCIGRENDLTSWGDESRYRVHELGQISLDGERVCLHAL